MLVEYAVNLQLLCFSGVILKKHGSGMTIIEILPLSRNSTYLLEVSLGPSAKCLPNHCIYDVWQRFSQWEL